MVLRRGFARLSVLLFKGFSQSVECIHDFAELIISAQAKARRVIARGQFVDVPFDRNKRAVKTVTHSQRKKGHKDRHRQSRKQHVDKKAVDRFIDDGRRLRCHLIGCKYSIDDRVNRINHKSAERTLCHENYSEVTKGAPKLHLRSNEKAKWRALSLHTLRIKTMQVQRNSHSAMSSLEPQAELPPQSPVRKNPQVEFRPEF